MNTKINLTTYIRLSLMRFYCVLHLLHIGRVINFLYCNCCIFVSENQDTHTKNLPEKAFIFRKRE